MEPIKVHKFAGLMYMLEVEKSITWPLHIGEMATALRQARVWEKHSWPLLIHRH